MTPNLGIPAITAWQSPSVKDAAQLDREIAESYLGKRLTASNPVFPKRRVTGIARRVDSSLRGDVMLWLELSDGSRVPVFLTDVVPEVLRAVAHYRKSSRVR